MVDMLACGVATAPPPSSEAVSDRMRRTKTAGTPAEISLRSALHRRGLRFRVQRAIEGAPRIRPDIVFVSARVAVFVDGCFWHRCPQHRTDPKANGAWWREKLERNAARDRRVDRDLSALGWRVIRVWEHEESEAVADAISGVVDPAFGVDRSGGGRSESGRAH
jgi:DNA mismatch endonuclease (patch repair protein)